MPDPNANIGIQNMQNLQKTSTAHTQLVNSAGMTLCLHLNHRLTKGISLPQVVGLDELLQPHDLALQLQLQV